MGEILMLTQYIEAAMRHAVIEFDEGDDCWYGEIPPCCGVLGMGSTEEECRKDTQEVLEGWIIVGLRFDDTLPVINGVDLNVKEAA
jgi:predicted RNase H-like HicB family nuclease